MAEKSGDRAINADEADLKAGVLYPAKKPSLTAETQSLMEKRAWLAALRDHRQSCGTLQTRKLRSPKSCSSRRGQITQRIAELTQKVAEGNFTRKPGKPPVILDAEGAMLKGQLETIKRTFERGLELDRLRSRTRRKGLCWCQKKF